MRRLVAALGLALSVLLVSPSWAQEASGPTVNINTAGAAEIAEVLQGVGQAKADAIVAYRTEHGAFASVESLAEVKGIGASTLANNQGRIVLE
ncbi:hypothetical protein GCM10007421_12590 [Halopseudomonas oceani]|jgi:competence protein ComEA|uniref:Competence protein ComEA n=1 Tax=Halopseudomonas oceani TaxID=1708783 RepID=A0A2P4EWU2_9GAMM|nr:helix-hairpin-helix domain-containing protein [Halopseudomonas oceani]POB04456.1 hypothetical protein C1949_05635 [Halopseudomonas oceani]GGE40076.1 hypothetical protein GCM10007421_12590 [Halopseudomonas oceani]